MQVRHYLSFAVTVLVAFSVASVETAVGSVNGNTHENTMFEKNLTAKLFNFFDRVHEQRVRFAAKHGVTDPVALVASVMHSPMANLLISIAIEESRGDPIAIGSSGEQGAWQVRASSWGQVPKDIIGQAGQAEKIIRSLLIGTKGNRKKALAHYNGGTTPPGRSYLYAERILKRTKRLQVAVNHLQANYSMLRQAMLEPPCISWLL